MIKLSRLHNSGNGSHTANILGQEQCIDMAMTSTFLLSTCISRFLRDQLEARALDAQTQWPCLLLIILRSSSSSHTTTPHSFNHAPCIRPIRASLLSPTCDFRLDRIAFNLLDRIISRPFGKCHLLVLVWSILHQTFTWLIIF